ncbi:MAG: S8 family serine peptidase [Planctomycetaceae bacterium]|nr:S8 family serine peptidase [Planctomycetaceae bacterium]
MKFFWYSVIFFISISPAIAAEDCNCGKSVSRDGKLIKPEKIYQQFEQGDEKVKVIINLKQPEMLREKKVNWRSRESKNLLHKEVKNRQDKLIDRFSANEFHLRHRFENQAGFSCEATADALEKILADPNVESVEPVEYLYKHTSQGIPLINGSVYRSTYNGQGVAIAICDTGVDYNHPMLGGGGFPNSKVIGGYDFGDSDSDPFPASDEGHGTCCAGIAAGDLGSTGSYIGGVAYNAKIYALKVENSAGSMTSDKIIASWDWCVTHQYDDPNYPILVISISLGSDAGYSSYCDSSNTSYADAVSNAAAAGISIVVSSGNDGFCNSIASPACLSGTIAVGAVYDAAFGNATFCVDSSSCASKTVSSSCSTGYSATDATAADKVTSYSNVASILDVFAPSNQAYTTDMVGSAGYSSGDYYASFGGTSAAAPYTAGAIACLQQAAKEITGGFLSPSQIRDVLTSTGDNVTDTKVAITKPRVNIANAIDSLYGMKFVQIGTGTFSWYFPFHTGSKDNRTQTIYLADEITTGGTISALQLYVPTVPGRTMTNWTIRMKHTSLVEYSSCELESSGWTTVYQADETIDNTGWHLFTFTTPFEYNSTDNLMVDFSFNNSRTAFYSGYCYCSSPGGNRTASAYANDTYGDPLDWSGSSSPTVSCDSYVPNIIFTVNLDSVSAPTLNAEPNITAGLCNNISWSDVPLADNYYAECAADSSFSSVEANSGWIADANYQFCSLANSQTYWYRVKAKNDTFDIESDWSNIVFSRQCATIGDFQPDCAVDTTDLAVIAEQWLSPEAPLSADIAPQPDGDGTVNFLDLAEFGLHWMQ